MRPCSIDKFTILQRVRINTGRSCFDKSQLMEPGMVRGAREGARVGRERERANILMDTGAIRCTGCTNKKSYKSFSRTKICALAFPPRAIRACRDASPR
jgi:hypothetical protein